MTVLNVANPWQTTVLTADLASINTQTTLQNITGLGLSIGASATEIWLAKWWLIVSAANATMDLKIGFTVPTSCTMKGGPITGAVATPGGWIDVAVATTPTTLLTQATGPAYGTAVGTTGINGVWVVYGGGTAGTVQIQYAQNTSDAGALQILKGSVLEATKLVA